MTLAPLLHDLETHGLVPLGAFEAREGDENIPNVEPGVPARSLLLVGNAGPALWEIFSRSAEHADGTPDALNRWSARVLGAIARHHGLGAVFPFEGPPYWPFQHWAKRAGGVSQSPMGVLVHPRYGPWFAYRGAFLFAQPVVLAGLGSDPGPCPSCADKPCLDVCPAGAIDRNTAYQAETCRDFVVDNPDGACFTGGCLVRHACPFGREYAYEPDQARFHMAAFAGV